MNPRVSICLPTYNGEPYLRQALESLLSQSFSDFEILVSDDCYKDGTPDILSEFQKQDKRLRLTCNKENAGLFANYNKCLARAETPFIKPFAQDDLLHPHYLERALSVFEKEPELVLLSTDRGLIDASGQAIEAEIAKSNQVFESNVPVSGNAVIETCLFPVINYIGEPSTVIFRKRACGQGFDESFHQLGDLEYWLRILMEGNYCYIPEQLCFFRWHDQSRSAHNARNLMVASDLIRLARKFAWVIEACGQSMDNFLFQSIDAFAGYVFQMSESGAISAESLSETAVLQQPLENESACSQKLLNDFVDFRELAFHALRMLGSQSLSASWTSATLKDRAENQKQIYQLEKELRNLLGSRSWCMTRPLRELSRICSATSTGVVQDFDFDPAADMKAQQEEYIGYLQDMIGRIQLSRSWKLTQPFRDFQFQLQLF